MGGTNTVVGFLLFAAFESWIFRDVPYGYLISLVLSYAIAIVLAFFLYRRFVFRVSGNVVTDFVRFVSVYALSIGINFLALPALVEIGGVPPIIAQAVVLVCTTVVSFVGHKFFSFRRSTRAEAPDL
ncbi:MULTISPECIES: GtrA family protein [Microbacterium]|uniref:GtrA family protein n=1 Tax=Microbacterium TaxID=33882 RepID=UPI001EF5CF4E|nr:GtrA family protein [Microbacterium sp. KCTC 39802]